MGDPGTDFKSSMSTSKPGSPGGPIIEASPDPEEYNQALKIILGTVVGVIGIVGLIALFFLLYKFWQRRNYVQNGLIGRDRAASLRSVSVDVSNKQLPGVLLLYSYDCPMHEKVVHALAGFLMEICCCNVVLDLFEEQIIHERGLDDWLVERLQEVDFIVVVCSVGARLRCSKKRVRFKAEPNRTLPDYFAVAVDYVGEKMRVERSKGLPMSKFITVFMDYSTSSDIPPQLETGTKFCLMKDLNKIYNHLHGLEPDDTKFESTYPGVSESNYYKSEVGAELYVALEQAKEFFQNNPNWVEDRLHTIPQSSKSKSRHRRHNSQEQPLLEAQNQDLQVPSITNCVDAAVEVHTLPRTSGKDISEPGNTFLYSRQNSLPSSLSSHLTVHTSSNQVNTSKSYDSFRNCEKFRDPDSVACVLCGKHSHPDGRLSCKSRKSQQSDIEVDPEYSQSKSKSKSMPTVYGNSNNGSQTVLHAEIHKEWDLVGRVSPVSDLQDTDSNTGSDTLERDLRSITVPPTFDNVHYSTSAYLLSELIPLRSLSSSALAVSNSDHRIKPVPTLQLVDAGLSSDDSNGTSFSLGPVISLNLI